MEEEGAQNILENQFLAFKNMKRNNESKRTLKEIKLSLEELVNEKSEILRELQIQFQELTAAKKSMEIEQEKSEEYLKRELVLIAQQENIINDKAREMKMRNEFKLQYDQRLMKASSKPSSKDLQLIKKYKDKLTAYKKMTGIIWDHASCTENKLSGYVLCDDNKLKVFHLDIAGLSRESYTDALWEIIEKYNI